MKAQFVHVGHGNFIAAEHILAIADPESAPAKKDMIVLGGVGRLRDFTKGRKIGSLIYLDDGTAIRSALYPEVIADCLGDKLWLYGI